MTEVVTAVRLAGRPDVYLRVAGSRVRSGPTSQSAADGWTELAAAADSRRERSLTCLDESASCGPGLLAAATTAALVGAPAMIQAGITMTGID